MIRVAVILAALLLPILARAQTTENWSKGENYTILDRTGPNASKFEQYGILNRTGPDLSKTETYVIVQQAASASKLENYAIVCSPPGVGLCPAVIGSSLPYRRPPGSRITR